ncbi:alkaline phosphatase family protein [Salinirarus marinus]|uniref:alkaline phosphatase family protein n=1 Tax=Salinirarus marinus TaxID=3068310 RepID=UPI003C6CA128
MFAVDVERAIRDARETGGYLRPAYDDFCVARVPATAGRVLDADVGPPLPADALADVETDVEVVVVALVDGYGYTQWRRDYEAVPFLDRLTRRAGVTPLTSVYPSETAAAMTTLHTGRTPAEHGLLGWNLYVEADDLTIRSLPFRTLAGEDPRSVDASVTPADLFAGRPIYERLGEAGVTSHVLSPESLAGSAYSSVASAGAATPGYADVSDAEASLRRIVESAGDRTYVLAYFPQVDAAGHETGTESATYRDRLSSVAATLGRFVRRLDAADARRTLLVVTADHGQVNTDPTTNVDLLELDGVASRLRRHGGGETDAEGVAGSESPVVAGSARNVHLFCEEGAEVRRSLARELDARTFTRAEALAESLFGPGDPAPALERRCGDLVVVPRDRGVWHGRDPRLLEHVGMHGGLHPDEMLVPFAAARVADL